MYRFHEKYYFLKYDSKVKSINLSNNATLSASSVISHELPLNGVHENIDDHDDDVDLVILFNNFILLWTIFQEFCSANKKIQFRYFVLDSGNSAYYRRKQWKRR